MKYELDILIRTEGGSSREKRPHASPDNDSKVLLSCSVHEASFLLRLLIDAKVIVNKSTTQVFRQFINTFTVPKSSELTLGSFKNKYYQPDGPAIEKVKLLLMDLFDIARKY